MHNTEELAVLKCRIILDRHSPFSSRDATLEVLKRRELWNTTTINLDAFLLAGKAPTLVNQIPNVFAKLGAEEYSR